MKICGIDPGILHSAIATIECFPGETPVLAGSLLLGGDYQDSKNSIDRVNKIRYSLREFAFSQKPDLIAIEAFTWITHDENRDDEKIKCPKCHHVIPLPKGEKGLPEEAQEMYRLMGALGTLQEIAPIIEMRPAEWRILLTGQPMPKKIRRDGVVIRTGFEHLVRKEVYFRLNLNGGDNLSIHEVDAAGIALAALCKQ